MTRYSCQWHVTKMGCRQTRLHRATNDITSSTVMSRIERSGYCDPAKHTAVPMHNAIFSTNKLCICIYVFCTTRGRPWKTWKRTVEQEVDKRGKTWSEIKRLAKHTKGQRPSTAALCSDKSNYDWWLWWWWWWRRRRRWLLEEKKQQLFLSTASSK